MEAKAVLVQGIEVSYREAGEGQPILILHGWGSSSERWKKVQELLVDAGLRVVVPDMPGFGKTPPPSQAWGVEEYLALVERFVDSLGFKRFSLIGHSFGGALALSYAVRHPEHVQNLVLVAAAVRRRRTFKKKVLALAAKAGKPLAFLPFFPLLRKAFYKFIVRKSDYLFQRGVQRESYRKVISQDLSHLASAVDVPTLVLWGGKDDVVPVADARFLTEHIQDAELVVFPAGDHDLEQKMPEALATKILSFFQA